MRQSMHYFILYSALSQFLFWLLLYRYYRVAKYVLKSFYVKLRVQVLVF